LKALNNLTFSAKIPVFQLFYSRGPMLFEKISVRIVTEVTEVNRVVYDITNKPPGTVEWE